MTHADLDELVRQARRDRSMLSLLPSVARSLRVPFMAAPPAAVAAQKAPVALLGLEQRESSTQRLSGPHAPKA